MQAPVLYKALITLVTIRPNVFFPCSYNKKERNNFFAHEYY